MAKEPERMPTDVEWMECAVQLAWKCPRVESAFAVGAVIVDAHGHEIATGYSRETDEKVHAEESALAKLGAIQGCEHPRSTRPWNHAASAPAAQNPVCS